MILFLILFGLSAIYSLLEILYNIRTRNVLLLDGEFSEADSKLIHADYLLIRLFFFALMMLLSFSYYDPDKSKLVLLFGSMMTIATSMWMCIDIFAANLMVKKPWWFIGTTSAVDSTLSSPKLNWTIKFMLLLTSIILLVIK